MDLRYWKAGEKVNVSWEDWYPKCVYPLPPAPLSEQVADLEKRKAQVEKELADLKAKRDAEEAAKAKAQTYGEKVAEGIVRPYIGGSIHFMANPRLGGHAFPAVNCGKPVEQIIKDVREWYAAALDKAHADGRAEQREKDATILDEQAAFWGPNGYQPNVPKLFREIATEVRDNK